MDNGTWTDPMTLGELYECAWRSLSKLLLVHVVLVNKNEANRGRVILLGRGRGTK